MDQLIAHGEIKRGQLGVTIQDLTPDLTKTLRINAVMGAVVIEVVAGSPAEKAGIKEGDVITKVNGQPISGVSEFRNKISLMPIGSELHITLIRRGAAQEVTAVLAEAKAPPTPPVRRATRT
ncbi:MAG: S1C family serine protease [Xanthobacteraceae bacterium]